MRLAIGLAGAFVVSILAARFLQWHAHRPAPILDPPHTPDNPAALPAVEMSLTDWYRRHMARRFQDRPGLN